MARPGIKPHEELQHLLPFERLLAEISTLFINLPTDQIDNEIDVAQSRICELLDIDRSTLWIVSEDDPGFLLLGHVYPDPGFPAASERMSAKDFWPWSAQKVLAGETVVISKMSELPVEAGRDRENYCMYGTKSTVLVPLSAGRGKVLGALSFGFTREERDWPKTVVQQFELVAQIFANALSRKQAEKSLEERLQFEMLLADISAHFVNLPSDQVDGAIEDAQRRVCACLGLDLSALWQWSPDTPELLTMTHIYRSQEGPPLPDPMNAQEYFPWGLEQLKAGKIVAVSSMDELPAEASRDEEAWRFFGVKTSLAFPLSVGDGPPIGALSFNTLQAERTWPETIVKRLQLIVQIFTNALARQRVERELVKSERRLRLITNALPVLIGYIDSNQRYQFNNDAYIAWFGVSPAEASGRTVREVVGETYYQRIVPYIERALSGEHVTYIQDVVLDGGRTFSSEAIYVPDFDENNTVRGFYTLVMDVTERRIAQQESKRLQDELTHASRITTMGELAGALAHEISQPLAAIMSNAQAARRYLDGPHPDIEEVKDILQDIVSEDSRAGEVINRLRGFLKKSATVFEQVDLNQIIKDVVGLVQSDVVLRDVRISIELAAGLPAVQGDRIQLQQVALNIVLNAFDAVSDQPRGARQVWIRTNHRDSAVHVSVADNGKGVSEAELENVFKPFFTTKAHGLGMGLSISRSIITRHHGRIWMENNPEGTTFYFSLPAAAA